ncbi:MAG: hypothetical protein OEQ53_05260 [Saprospiraceae bacterium]|nr:hypothetical protein [Saprospiraceae bacterium]
MMISDYPFLPSILAGLEQFSNKRVLIGIVGPPASGKSYLVKKIVLEVNQDLGEDVATYFSMDGYHYHNDFLHERGMYVHKGAHFTFDAEGFIQKLVEIKEFDGAVNSPIYDRSLHNPTPDGDLIKETHRMVFVEGNYLMTTIYPWIIIKYLLDYSVFLEVELQVQIDRLMMRHMASGKSRQEAADKIARTDLPNSALILESKQRTDYVLKPQANFR